MQQTIKTKQIKLFKYYGKIIQIFEKPFIIKTYYFENLFFNNYKFEKMKRIFLFFYRVNFLEYYRNYYLKYETSNDQIYLFIIVDQSDIFLINSKIKALRKKQRNQITKLFNEVEQYLQKSITDSRKQKFVLM